MARKSTKARVQKRLFSSPSSSSTTIGRDAAANDENLPPPEDEEEREGREEGQQEEERMEEDGVFLAPSTATSVPRRQPTGSSERKKGRRKNGQQRGDGDTTPKNFRRPAASPATPGTPSTRSIPWPESQKFVTERMAELKRRHSRLVQETGTLNLRIDKMFPDLVKPSDRIDPFETVGAPRTFVWMSHRGRAEMEKEKGRIDEEIRMGRTSKAARERDARQKRADMYGNLKAKIRETWDELTKEAEIAIQNERKALAAAVAVDAAAAAE